MTEKYTMHHDNEGSVMVLDKDGTIIAIKSRVMEPMWDFFSDAGLFQRSSFEGDPTAAEIGARYEELLAAGKPVSGYDLGTDEETAIVVKDKDGDIIASIIGGDWHFFADGLLVGRAPINGEPDPAAVGALHAALVRFRGEVGE